MVGVGEEMMRLCLSMGFELIVGGGDVMFLAGGSKQASADARAMVEATAAPKVAAGEVKSVY
jgi:hypothetical protein